MGCGRLRIYRCNYVDSSGKCRRLYRRIRHEAEVALLRKQRDHGNNVGRVDTLDFQTTKAGIVEMLNRETIDD